MKYAARLRTSSDTVYVVYFSSEADQEAFFSDLILNEGRVTSMETMVLEDECAWHTRLAQHPYAPEWEKH